MPKERKREFALASIRIAIWCSAFVVAFAGAGCKSQSSPNRSEVENSRDDPNAQNQSNLAQAKEIPKLAFSKEDTVFLNEASKAIPIGTPIDEAERLLSANGFDCKRIHDSDGKPGLLARLSKRSTLFTSWVWVLWILEEDGKVSGITGSTAGLGP
jgi:hypothetical protein